MRQRSIIIILGLGLLLPLVIVVADSMTSKPEVAMGSAVETRVAATLTAGVEQTGGTPVVAPTRKASRVPNEKDRTKQVERRATQEAKQMSGERPVRYDANRNLLVTPRASGPLATAQALAGTPTPVGTPPRVLRHTPIAP